ncbi:MAG: Electron transport complex protein RnfE [Bacteroidetes bacterium ADurb.Bin408]|nr:MAG: Electron transport complex protein RnfE [Bacteroidetes bacterium ADurb.Bin408]
MENLKYLTNGIIKENPLLILVLGTCPSLAVTTSVTNGIGMGAAVTFVLVCSNFIISLLKNFIPNKVRIAAFIVVIASFVTIVDLVMQAFTPDLYKALGVFIPLIVVNCIILGRAEAFAQKNTPVAAIMDGIGMGIGFTLALCVMAAIRELLGNGSLMDVKLVGENAKTILIFILPPGAFMTFGYLIAIMNVIKRKFNI